MVLLTLDFLKPFLDNVIRLLRVTKRAMNMALLVINMLDLVINIWHHAIPQILGDASALTYMVVAILFAQVHNAGILMLMLMLGNLLDMGLLGELGKQIT